MDIAMTAIMFVPGLQGAAWAYRGYRAYRSYRSVTRGYRAYRAIRAAKYASRAIQKGVGTRRTKVWVRKYPSGGGGVGINRNGTNVFRAGRTNWKQNGEWVTGLRKYSVHYGKTSSQRGRHRPWQ
jgi:hypothetical protein